MGDDRVDGQVACIGYLLVQHALGHTDQNLLLACREVIFLRLGIVLPGVEGLPQLSDNQHRIVIQADQGIVLLLLLVIHRDGLQSYHCGIGVLGYVAAHGRARHEIEHHRIENDHISIYIPQAHLRGV